MASVHFGRKHASLSAPCLQTSQMSPLKAAKLPFPRSAFPALAEALTPADATQPAMRFVEGLLLDAIVDSYSWSQSAQGSIFLWTKFSLCCLHTCYQLNCDCLRSLQ